MRFNLTGILTHGFTAAALMVASITQAQNEITNPIPEVEVRTGLTVGLELLVRLPNSQGQPARVNFMEEAPDGSGRLFAIDQRGFLYIVSQDSATVYLTLDDHVDDFLTTDNTQQQGFTYFTFDPGFASNGVFYTVHSADKIGAPDFPSKRPIIDSDGNVTDSSHHDVISKWTANDPAANTFSGTVTELMRIEQPYRDHNTGQLSFNPHSLPGDPDFGMLYIAVADGGSDGFPVSDTDPLDNGQDLSTPLGALLRIDPFGSDSANGQYGIPADNPFASDGDNSTLGEIWAYGLRNPHRYSWDMAGERKMLLGDIGQWYIEEINLMEVGLNYGWGEREGTWVIDEENEFVLFPLPANDDTFDYTYPVLQYDHPGNPDQPWTGSGAITGGYVYRGQMMPHMVGKFIFADFTSDGRFFYAQASSLEQGSVSTMFELTLEFDGRQRDFNNIVGSGRNDARFAVDRQGEMYVSSKQNGSIYRLVAPSNMASYTVEPSLVRLDAAGDNATLEITVEGSFPDWGLSRLPPEWLSLGPETEGSGNATLTLSAPENNGDLPRLTDLIIAGQSIRVIQDGQVDNPVALFFPAAIPTGNPEEFTDPGFGNFTLAGEPLVTFPNRLIIDHEAHGQLYVALSLEGTVWLWDADFYAVQLAAAGPEAEVDPRWGWLWLDPSLHPFFYDLTRERWIYYLEGFTNPRYFYSYVFPFGWFAVPQG